MKHEDECGKGFVRNLLVMLAVMILLMLAAFFVSDVAKGATVGEIQEAIEDSTVGWNAEESPFSLMPVEERKKMLMPSEDMVPILTMPLVEYAVPLEELPVRFSWTDHDGSNWMSPVRQQGRCGACWTFAALGIVEATIRIQTGAPDSQLDLSEQFAISCLPGGCSGGLPSIVLHQLRAGGIPLEECFPYKANQESCNAVCIGWESNAIGIAGHRWLTALTGGDRLLKSHLAEVPLATSMLVYADLWSYRDGVYQHVTGDLEGLHSVVLVGWDDEENFWIVRNSWGEDWGEDGYFRIKRGDSAIGAYALRVYVNPEDVPEVEPPPIVGCGCSIVW